MCVFDCAEKDWEDIRKMPEFATLMKDFGRLRPKYVLITVIRIPWYVLPVKFLIRIGSWASPFCIISAIFYFEVTSFVGMLHL